MKTRDKEANRDLGFYNTHMSYYILYICNPRSCALTRSAGHTLRTCAHAYILKQIILTIIYKVLMTCSWILSSVIDLCFSILRKYILSKFINFYVNQETLN